MHDAELYTAARAAGMTICRFRAWCAEYLTKLEERPQPFLPGNPLTPAQAQRHVDAAKAFDALLLRRWKALQVVDVAQTRSMRELCERVIEKDG